MSKVFKSPCNSKTKAELKDLWRTSDLAYRDACALVGVREFDVDAAACARSTKCRVYFSAEYDALDRAWTSTRDRYVWCNPPFSSKVEFLQKAYEQRAGGVICMMLPFEPVTTWWRKNVDGKASIVYVPDGRYNYVDPATGREVNGVNFASAFVVFTSLTMPTQYVQFARGISNAAS